MTEQEKAIITIEQAHFLMDLDLSTFSKKVEAIEKAKENLKFENEYDKDSFYKAVESGLWDIHCDYFVINPINNFDQPLFIALSNFIDDNGKQKYYITSEIEDAALLTLDDLYTIEDLSMYRHEAFLLSEYEAHKKYGNADKWLRNKFEFSITNNEEIANSITDNEDDIHSSQIKGEEAMSEDKTDKSDVDLMPVKDGTNRIDAPLSEEFKNNESTSSEKIEDDKTISTFKLNVSSNAKKNENVDELDHTVQTDVKLNDDNVGSEVSRGLYNIDVNEKKITNANGEVKSTKGKISLN